MTRDQAIQLLENARIPYQGSSDILEPLVKYPDRWIEMFIALGMLKLDEPKSAAERLAIELDLAGVSTGGINNFFDCVARANVKIIEK